MSVSYQKVICARSWGHIEAIGDLRSAKNKLPAPLFLIHNQIKHPVYNSVTTTIRFNSFIYLQPHPHRRSTTKLADFSATVDPASAKAPIFKPPADTKLVMEPRSEKNSDDTSLLWKGSGLTDDVSEDHIDNSEPDDKLASVSVMQVMMKTHS